MKSPFRYLESLDESCARENLQIVGPSTPDFGLAIVTDSRFDSTESHCYYHGPLFSSFSCHIELPVNAQLGLRIRV